MLIVGFAFYYEEKPNPEKIVEIKSFSFLLGTEQSYEPYFFKTRFQIHQNERVL